MAFVERLKSFARSEDGAVTVDWVVLTAAICFVSVALIASIQTAVVNQATGIGAAVVEKGSTALNENKYP